MRCVCFLLVMAVLFNYTGISYSGETMLDKAWAYYLKGDYDKAIDTCRAISNNRILGEEGRYIMGLSFLNLGKAQEAKENFQFILDNYPKSQMQEELFLGIGDSYYIEGKFEAAEEYYKKLLRNFSDTGYASIVYLRLGISQKKQGKWQEAEASFSKLLRDYPLSLEAEDAKAYPKKEEAFFSIQVGAFSKKENAQRLCSKLLRKGYDAAIEKKYEGDGLLYCVKIGKFSAREQALKEAAKLKKQGFSTRIRP